MPLPLSITQLRLGASILQRAPCVVPYLLTRLIHSSNHKYDYDLIILGGGAAGVAAAARAWDLKKKVLLIEKKWLGGAMLWDGALSSKCMWQISRQTQNFKEMHADGQQRLRSGKALANDLACTTARHQVYDSQLVKSGHIEAQLEALQRGGYSSSLETEYGGVVDTVVGHGSFIDPHTISIACEGKPLVGSRSEILNNTEVEFRQVTAENILIATGSRPREIPQWPTDGQRIINSNHIQGLRTLPKSVCIIGAGVIGCEFAAIFSNFGQTHVQLVNEGRARLLPTEDLDLSRFITKSYENCGVVIHNMVKVINVDAQAHGVEVTLGDSVIEDGIKKIIPREPFTVEKVLLAIGRVANVQQLNLEAAGVETKSGTAILANKHAQTNVPHIYAAGDATMDIGLVSVAEMEARHAVEHMFSEDPKDDPCDEMYDTPLSYDNVSSIMFLTPEVACVGMNEQAARRANIPYKVAYVGLDINNRGIINCPHFSREYFESPSSLDMSNHVSAAKKIAAGETNLERMGFVKMIVTADSQSRLLGMRAAGENSSAIIQAAALLIVEKQSIRMLERLLHPHPAITE
eukprot:Ihof_evm4s201 gene=Ihof_evmTU4s201